MPRAKNGQFRRPSAQQQRAQAKARAQRPKYSTASRAWQQSVAAPPAKPFGSRKSAKKYSVKSMCRALNARLPAHLGLPRAVGNYTVVRTTTLHSSSARFIMFAPFLSRNPSSADIPIWLSMCGVEDVNSAGAVNAAGNTRAIAMPFPGVTPSTTHNALSIVPAALTVQVMNPSAVSAAGGIFAMGRCNQQWDIGGNTETYDTMVERFISFFSPRLMSGGKLAFRGVAADSYPLDMTEYSTFASVAPAPGTHGVDPFQWTDNIVPAALAPIVMVQRTSPAVALEFLVTIEWRVRFDPGNAACASHSYHPPVSDSMYGQIIQHMQAAGHGVEDIAERVAAGAAVVEGAAAVL